MGKVTDKFKFAANMSHSNFAYPYPQTTYAPDINITRAKRIYNSLQEYKKALNEPESRKDIYNQETLLTVLNKKVYHISIIKNNIRGISKRNFGFI